MVPSKVDKEQRQVPGIRNEYSRRRSTPCRNGRITAVMPSGVLTPCGTDGSTALVLMVVRAVRERQDCGYHARR